MSPRALRVAILGPRSGWHTQRLAAVLAQRGHEVSVVRVTRMSGRVDGLPAILEGELALEACDVVVVRGIPAGSLEQIIFRVDALHLLEAAGVTVVNAARAIERTVDKFLASALLARAGLSTPRTVACQSREEALRAFDELGGDVIVKPLFGAMGLGMARVEHRDIAHRVFGALEIQRAVFYLQETIAHAGRDVRALVIGGLVVAAMERSAGDWRVNLARGARAREVRLDACSEELCVRAAAALAAEVAGVDLLRGPDGRQYVVEVNGIPGWQGLEGATGVDVARAVVAHVEGLVAR